MLAIWFGAVAALARRAAWRLSWRLPAAMLIRDLMLPPLWVVAWVSDEVKWRGSTVCEAGRRGLRLRQLTASPAYAVVRRLTSGYRRKWLSR